jgi:hypothetical protein
MNRILTPQHPGASVVMAASQSHEFYTTLARNILSDISKNKAGVYLKISQAQTTMLVVSFQGCHYPDLLPNRAYLLDRVAEDRWTGVVLPFIVTPGDFCADITPDGKHVALGFLDSGVILLRKQAPGQWHEEQQIPKGTYGLSLTDSAGLKFAGGLHFSPNSRVLMLGSLRQSPENAWLCPAAFLFVYCQGKWHYAHGQYSQGVLERGWFEQVMKPWLEHTEDALCRAIEAQLPAPELIDDALTPPRLTSIFDSPYPVLAEEILETVTHYDGLGIPFQVEDALVMVSKDKRVIVWVREAEAVQKGLSDGAVELLARQPNGFWNKQTWWAPKGFKLSTLAMTDTAEVLTLQGDSPTALINLYYSPEMNEWTSTPLESASKPPVSAPDLTDNALIQEIETEADLVSALKPLNRKTELTGSLETSTGIQYETLATMLSTQPLAPEVIKVFERSRVFFSQNGQVIVLVAEAVDLEEKPLRNGLYVLWRNSQSQWVGCLASYDPFEGPITLDDETIVRIKQDHTVGVLKRHDDRWMEVPTVDSYIHVPGETPLLRYQVVAGRKTSYKLLALYLLMFDTKGPMLGFSPPQKGRVFIAPSRRLIVLAQEEFRIPERTLPPLVHILALQEGQWVGVCTRYRVEGLSQVGFNASDFRIVLTYEDNGHVVLERGSQGWIEAGHSLCHPKAVIHPASPKT